MTFVALSGLPRTGSTLLTSILMQNPEIHAEGISALCQLMWDMQASCQNDYSSKALAANRRLETQNDLLRSIPAIYYNTVNASHIVDKCRSWTLPDNVQMIRRYITDDPKIIVMVRPVDEIVASFARVRAENGLHEPFEDQLWKPNTEPLTRPLAGVEYAKANNRGEYLFIEYRDLVEDVEHTIGRIYDFCGWEHYEHYYDNIMNPCPEEDMVWGLSGLHDIRPSIGYR